MPEIDTELFQQIVLGLMALLVLLVLLLLNSLGKIRKTLERGIPTMAGGNEPVASPARESTQAEPAPSQTAVAQPAEAAAAEPAPAASEAYSPWSSSSAEPVSASVTQATPAASEAIPEEQPFERDGRWWFKRGDELLVYDEQTGQWTQAPAANPFSGGGTVQSVPQESSGGSPIPQTTTTEQMPAAEGGFWKCPSCGAVNGSTATTCRMCFTPRPA